MLHFGRNPQGDLELRATDEHIGILYRALCNAHLPDRGSVYALRTYIEENFSNELNRTIINN